MNTSNMAAAQVRRALENAASRGMTMAKDQAEELWADILLNVDPIWHPVLEPRVNSLIAVTNRDVALETEADELEALFSRADRIMSSALYA